MRLRPGQEIKQCLEEFVRDHGLNAAFVLTCCGSVTKATLRFAANKNNETNRVWHVFTFKWQRYDEWFSSMRILVLEWCVKLKYLLQIETLDEHFEICSLVGTITNDGSQLSSHLHTTLSRNDGSTVGGHVVSDMIVFTWVFIQFNSYGHQRYHVNIIA